MTTGFKETGKGKKSGENKDNCTPCLTNHGCWRLTPMNTANTCDVACRTVIQSSNHYSLFLLPTAPSQPPRIISSVRSGSRYIITWDHVVALSNESTVTGYKVNKWGLPSSPPHRFILLTLMCEASAVRETHVVYSIYPHRRVRRQSLTKDLLIRRHR